MCLSVEKVTIPESKGVFTDDFIFDIEFECTKQLKHPVTWEIEYRGSTIDNSKDQSLRTVNVSPIEVGVSRIVFHAMHPNPLLIDISDFNLAMIVLRGTYKGDEFFKSCWFVSNSDLPNNTYEGVDFTKIEREIDAETPQIHTTNICWQ